MEDRFGAWFDKNEDEREGGADLSPLRTIPLPKEPDVKVNQYSDWFQQENERSAERASQFIDFTKEVYKHSPEEAAELVDLSDRVQESGGPAIRPEDLDSLKGPLAEQLELMDRRAKLTGSSTLSDWIMESPINAALGVNDLHNLSTLDATLHSMGRAVEGLGRGAYYLARTSTAETVHSLFEQAMKDKDSTYMELFAEEKEGGSIIAPIKAFDRWLQSSLFALLPEELQGSTVEYTQEGLEVTLQHAAEGMARLDERWGRTVNYMRAAEKFEEIGKQEGFVNQISGFVNYILEEPGNAIPFLTYTTIDFSGGLLVGAAATWATRNPFVGAAAMGASSAAYGGSNVFQQLAQEMGYDLTDPEQRLAFVNTPEVRARVHDRTFAYAATIGMVDTLAGGMASKVFANNPIGDVVLQGLAQMAVGSAGETLAMMAADMDINWVEVATVGLANLLMTPGSMAGVGGRAMGTRLRKRMHTNRDKRFFEELSGASEESILRGRLPKKFREVVERMTQDGPIENLFVDADEFHQLARTLGVPSRDLAARFGSDLQEQIMRALDLGQPIEIPTARYATEIVGQDFEMALREHLKTTPDGMSAFEAEGLRQQFSELAERAEAAAEEAEVNMTPDERLLAEQYSSLVSQLRRAGNHARAAEMQAAQSMAMVRTLSQRLGVPVSEFLARYPMADVRRVFDSEAEVIRVSPEIVEHIRTESPDTDTEVIAAIRSAAEEVGLDPRTATDAELADAAYKAYGPVAGGMLLHQARGEATAERLSRPVVEADFTGIDPDFLARPGWAILTASRQVADDAQRNANLEADMQELGIPYRRQEGMYQGVSDGVSYLAFVDEATALRLGAKYDQDSILTRKGLQYIDGRANTPLNLDDLVTGDAARAREFYSVTEDGEAWSVGFAEDSQLYQRGIDSPAFREWFGDSVVVDAEGNPLVVYHGTATPRGTAPFEVFDGMAWGATEQSLALDYAAMRAMGGDSEARIIEAYMRIERPFDADLGLPKTVTIGQMLTAMIEQAAEQGRVMDEGSLARLQELSDIIDAARREEGSGPHYARHDFWNETSMMFGKDGAAAIREAFEITGFDGVKMDEGGAETFGVFNPEQIKSVDNVGTFDPSDPNIFHQGGRYNVKAIEARAKELEATLEPLKGIPNVEGAYGPDPYLHATAEAYMASIGQEMRRQRVFVEIDPERAARIADAFERMPHNPQDPQTQRAYRQLIDQTRAQYDALTAAGYVFYFMDPNADPYKGNPWNAMRDLRNNREMAVYPTEDGFGSGDGDVNVSDQPLLEDTGLRWGWGSKDGPTRPVTANDLFRAVHDAFGHGLEGAGFRARGEENAWQAHVRMFTGMARAALTSETRGQNSWLNYGPHGERNRTAKIEDTIFADQKAGIMDPWTYQEGLAPNFHRTFPVNPDGTVTLTHWSSAPREVLSPEMAGTGPLKGEERFRAGPKKVYFGVNVGEPGGYRKEARLGGYRHEVEIPLDQLYDLHADPEGIFQLYSKENSFIQIGKVEQHLKDAGYRGYYATEAPQGVAVAVFDEVTPARVINETEFFQSGAEPIFFSELTRQVENAKQKRADAKDWKAIIAKLPGVKKAEIDWSGVNDWLDSQTGQVEREAVAAFLRSNEFEIEVVSVGEEGSGGRGEIFFDETDTRPVEPDAVAVSELAEELAVEIREDRVFEQVDEMRRRGLEDEYEAAGGENFQLEAEEALFAYVDNLTPKEDTEAQQVINRYIYETVADLDETSIMIEAENRARDSLSEDAGEEFDVTIERDGDTETETVRINSDREFEWDGNTYSIVEDLIQDIEERYGIYEQQQVKFEQYTERGGTDYKEILLTLPDLHEIGPNVGRDADPYVNASHFEEPNVVAFARTKARKAADGGSVLFVEEIQSDLGSDWREIGGSKSAMEGFEEAQARSEAARVDFETTQRRLTEELPRIKELAQLPPEWETLPFYDSPRVWVQAIRKLISGVPPFELGGRWDLFIGNLPMPGQEGFEIVQQFLALDEAAEKAKGTFNSAVEAMENYRKAQRLPMTPFEGEAYYALMVRNLLRMAVDEGADYLAWTPGYMQARRWSGAVQNVVHSIGWMNSGQTHVTGTGETVPLRAVTLTGVNGVNRLFVDPEGIVRGAEGWNERHGDVVGKRLSDVIGGGPIPKRILSEDGGYVEGENIVVGGDGYKIAYDQQIKRFVEQFAKRHGGKLTVDKTMPDFMSEASVTLDTVNDYARRLGYQNTVEHLRGTLGDEAFWTRIEEAAREDAAARKEYLEERLNNFREEVRHLEGELAVLPDDRITQIQLEDARNSVRRQEEELARIGGEDSEGFAAEVFRRVRREVRLGDLAEALLPEDMLPSADPVWSVKITDKMREAASKAQPLFQRRHGDRRGSIILPREEGATPVINLFESADLSTFLHESGHQFLYILQDLHKRGDLQGQMATDWQTITDWWAENADAVAKDGGVSEAQVRQYLRRGTTGDPEVDAKVNVGLHEQWARAYEAYLMEGKAPSNALRAAFEAFSAWLKNLYQSALELDVKLSDEMREVFDRLLATDQEIAAVADEHGFADLIADSAEALGVDAAEYARLVRLSEESIEEARQNTLSAIMQPLRAQRRVAMQEQRKEITERVTAEVNSRPHNRVREWLGNGRWLGEDAPAELPADLRLNRQELIDDYGMETLAALPRGKFTIWKSEGGVSADEAAGWFGYRSGDHMIQDLLSAPKAADEIRARVREEMRKGIPDPLTDGSMEITALRALHGEKRGQLLAAELRALKKNAPVGEITTLRQARAIARETIRRMPMRQAVRNNSYLAAERRAGERAQQLLAKGDRAGAFEAKRQQLLNYALFRESVEADKLLARVDRKVKQLSSKGTRKNLAGEYLEAIDDILTTYDFRRGLTQRAERRREGLRNYVQMMEEAGRANELAIPEHVLAEAGRRPYRTLTPIELEGVLDALLNIEHTARLKKKLIDAQRQRDLDVVVEKFVEEFDANVSDNPRNRVKTRAEKLGDSVREYLNLVLNADTILRKIGGFKQGEAYAAIKTPIDEAAVWAHGERLKATEAFDNLYRLYTPKERTAMGRKRYYNELGGSFSQWDLISAALNMGNADNLARLMDKDSGRGFTEQQVDFIKDQLTSTDWDFVEGMWRLIDSYWPMIVERERRATGVAPKKVEPIDVVLHNRVIEGGYYPIKYDGDLSGKASTEEIADVQKRMQAGRFGKAQTRDGHLKERAGGSGGRVLKLGVEIAHQHVGQVIHDLAYSEAVNNAWKVLQDPRVVAAFERKNLLNDHQSLEMWLQDVATGPIVGGGLFGKISMQLKHNFTLSKLMFNLSTVAIQLSGIAQSQAQIGSKAMLTGLTTYISNPAARAAEVMDASPFMATRQTSLQRDMNDYLSAVAGSPMKTRMDSMKRWVGAYGFWLFQKVQFYAVDMPTWLGAYDSRIKSNGGNEADARHYADRMVARAQSSGLLPDQSAFERGTTSRDSRMHGFIRLFTTLGSYMFAKGNIAYEVYGRTRAEVDGLNARSAAAIMKAAWDLSLLFIVETLFYNLVTGRLPSFDGGDDDESWGAFLARETILSIMGTMPVARDAASGFSGFDIGAYSSVISIPVNLTRQVGQGELDLALYKALVETGGLATGVPSSQLNRILDAWYRMEIEGEDVSPVEFLLGRRG